MSPKATMTLDPQLHSLLAPGRLTAGSFFLERRCDLRTNQHTSKAKTQLGREPRVFMLVTWVRTRTMHDASSRDGFSQRDSLPFNAQHSLSLCKSKSVGARINNATSNFYSRNLIERWLSKSGFLPGTYGRMTNLIVLAMIEEAFKGSSPSLQENLRRRRKKKPPSS
ncbi:hypothetical protein VNO77_03413 [Canavalia gladiata]|uniref:Uncharacterized protein n=1 Tax=Canavalia gladiata TaxID=3824 RepID=A0AAN9N0B8_CANGL